MRRTEIPFAGFPGPVFPDKTQRLSSGLGADPVKQKNIQLNTYQLNL